MGAKALLASIAEHRIESANTPVLLVVIVVVVFTISTLMILSYFAS
jgi:hypothetical protein